ncbi:MAG: hypothetical protein HOW97_17065 [Catenulispora sp.]|nr:hypothetical protein [Catenulispora sp.]
MNALAWLRAQRRKPKYATGGFVPGPAGDEASIVPVGFKIPMPRVVRPPAALLDAADTELATRPPVQLAIESIGLEESARQPRDAIAESGITIRPNPKPDECLCCIGRYSTCRNPNR